MVMVYIIPVKSASIQWIGVTAPVLNRLMIV